mmetsp:Transcript_10046/g.19363  ORF Transcript_10046/g.19363 Transcript_10046/m.19363 type:complete len:160 (+) Transcript_10046:3-482(+)
MASRLLPARAPLPILDSDAMLCCCVQDVGGTEVTTEATRPVNPGFAEGEDLGDSSYSDEAKQEETKQEEAKKGFTVVVNKVSGAMMGLDISKVQKVGLKVQAVKAGLISEWNERQPSDDTRVRAGDLIVAINGMQGQCRSILHAIAEGGELRMAIARSS